MSFLTTSGTSLTLVDIIAWIEMKAQDTRMRETLSKHETALAARQKGSKPKKAKATCSNCSKTGHTLDKCWEPGEGSEGKAPDWFKNMKARKNGSGHEKANAAVDNIGTNNGLESCALLCDLSICMTDVLEPSCSFDWSSLSPQIDIIAAATSHLPYFFDSGATSHCSPNQADFSLLQPISA